MAFVFEKLSEADKACYDWSMFTGWIGRLPYPPPWWSIDRQRDIFFIWIQGPPHETDEFPMYALYWKGEVVRVEAQRSGIGKFDDGVDTTWTIRRIHIPDSLLTKKSDILQALKDAMTAEPVLPEKTVVRKSITFVLEGEAA